MIILYADTLSVRVQDGSVFVTGIESINDNESPLQKFLLKIPNGVFGEDTERRLLSVLELPTRMEQYDVTHK